MESEDKFAIILAAFASLMIWVPISVGLDLNGVLGGSMCGGIFFITILLIPR